jgi:hypothetical protein
MGGELTITVEELLAQHAAMGQRVTEEQGTRIALDEYHPLSGGSELAWRAYFAARGHWRLRGFRLRTEPGWRSGVVKVIAFVPGGTEHAVNIGRSEFAWPDYMALALSELAQAAGR